MTMINEVMTRGVQVIAPDTTLQRAAQLMDELNVGALPVCDGERLVGIVTDRDITVRAVASGKDPNTTAVRDVMFTDIVLTDLSGRSSQTVITPSAPVSQRTALCIAHLVS